MTGAFDLGDGGDVSPCPAALMASVTLPFRYCKTKAPHSGYPPQIGVAPGMRNRRTRRRQTPSHRAPWSI
jgi:hypothetical protein